MIVLGCWKTGTEQIVETSDPAVGCLCIGWMSGWWCRIVGLSNFTVGRLDDEESWLDRWLSFAWIDVVFFGSSFILLWGSIMVDLSSQHLRCEMSGQFMLHHYFESDEHERGNVLHNECWVLDEDREEMFFRRGFDSQHNLLILVASCSAVFCRVVLRFFPIVLSSVESRIALLRCTVRESWFPSCSSLFVCSAESCSSPCRV